jgi:hypothetical protein
LLPGLSGTRDNPTKVPVNKNKFAKIGANEFRRVVGFVGRLPHVADLNLSLCEETSSTVFSGLKDFLIELVWGNAFVEHFPTFFEVLEEKKLKELQLKKNEYLLDFQVASVTEFNLSDVFKVTLSSGVAHTVVFKEDRFIESLYTDSRIYTKIGQELCLIYNIMYAKTGTEAVAESFYRVVEKQEMDGGQSLEVLSCRAKVDWCFPPILQCERVLTEIAKIYINGDKTLGIKRHHIPVFKAKSSTDLSKVLKRLSVTPAKLLYLL